MRTVRILLAAIVALLLAAPSVAAERPKGKGKAPQLSPTAQAMLRMERLRETLDELDLTAEQKERLGKVREEFGPKMKAIFEKIEEVLTEEQRSAAEEAMKQAKEADKKGRELFAAIEAAIKLTDEQKEKMDAIAPEIRDVQREMMKVIRGILTPEQRENLTKRMQPQPKQRKPGAKKPKV